MRHGDKVNNLGRTAAHRRALLANLTIALIEHKRITTTLAKAKALRRYAEPLITKAKDNSTHSRRVVFSYLQNKEALKELFGTVAEKVGERPGGYLRVIKLGFRHGDGAETAMIEFVDFNETYNPNEGKVRQAKKTRRGGSKKVTDVSAVEAFSEEDAAPILEEAEVAEDQVIEAADSSAEVLTEAEEVAMAPVEAVEEVEETVEAAADEVTEVAEEAVEAAAEDVSEVSEEAVAEVEAEEPAADEATEEKKDEEQA